MIYAGILAGGTGTRMGISNMPKQFLELGKKPILIHTIEKFLLEPEIEKIVVGVHEDWVSHAEDLVEQYVSAFADKIIITPGGVDRNTTIENIINRINEYKPLTDEDIIVTHDSVRPFITLRIIKDNIRLAKESDAVDTVVEAVDTIVESTNGECLDFLNLYNSLDKEEKQILTDACKIFVIKGKKVALAKGEYSNIKITTVTDLKIAKSMLEDE